MAIDTRPRKEARASRTDPLLAARTRIPRPRFPVLARPRVDDLLSRGVRNRVTLVHAIAGAGKTTACASWAASADAYDVAWFSLDPADDAPRLCAGMHAALARTGAPWAANLPPAPDGSVAAPEFVAGIVAAIAGTGRPVVLVLDAVDGLDADRLAPVAPLIDHAPAELRLMLIGRRRPALRLARHRVSGELTDLTSTDLACDRAELAAYLDTAGHAPAGTGHDPDDLLERTDGWFAAVRLLADRELPPDVAEYVDDEVLGERSGDITGLLARIAALGHVTADLAAHLTGDAYTPERLATLTADGLLIADGPRLRCRAPLAGVLSRPPRAVRPEDRTRLLRDAAIWYAANGHPLAALRTALHGADADTTARILIDAGLRAVATAGPSAVEALLDAAEPEDGPAVALVRATARVFAGDAAGARRHLAAARAYADPAMQVKCATLDLLLGDEPGIVPGETTPADGEYAYATGLRRLYDGALRSAAGAFRSAADLLSGFPELAAHARGWAALALAWHGDLRDSERQIAACPGTGRSWPVALAQAWVCLERDDVRGAEAALAAQSAEPVVVAFPGEVDVAGTTGIVRVRTAIAHGDLDRARGILEGLPARGGYGAELRAAVDVELAHRSGNVALARRLAWKLAHPAEAAAAPFSGKAPAHRVLLGRVLLHADEPHDALNAVDALITAPSAPDDPPASWPADAGAVERIGALAVAAAAYGRLRVMEKAARLLTDALALAAAEAAYGALLACGQPLRVLATTHRPADAEHDRVRRELLRRFDLRPAVQRPAQATVGEEPLTRAELSVLRFLPSHMTNVEIAESLVVSVNTVKSHLRSIYRKLGVSSRRDAIGAADRLGLL